MSVNSNITKEDKLILAQLEDKIVQCNDRYMITTGYFLDMRQRSIAEKLLQYKQNVKYGFYGGFEDASRVIAVFLPEYIETDVVTHFEENPEDNPLVVLRGILSKGSPELSHRDYLGALMGLGIKREMTGDILVRPDGADIIVMREIASFIQMHMEKAGRARIDFKEVPVRELIIPEVRIKEMIESVASLRLDNVISAVFNLSRSKAVEAIEAGIVFVNGMEVLKAEKHVGEGDKLVLRGSGKAVLKNIEGKSSKGRTIIKINRYM